MGFLFNRGALGLDDGSIDWAANVIKARLSRTSETLDRDAVNMTGRGVAATDVILASKTGPTEDQANDRIGYGAGNPVFPFVAAGAEFDKLIVFKFSVDDAGSTPIANVPITPVTPNGGDIIVTLGTPAAFYSQQ